jgi:hypothetical protein
MALPTFQSHAARQAETCIFTELSGRRPGKSVTAVCYVTGADRQSHCFPNFNFSLLPNWGRPGPRTTTPRRCPPRGGKQDAARVDSPGGPWLSAVSGYLSSSGTATTASTVDSSVATATSPTTVDGPKVVDGRRRPTESGGRLRFVRDGGCSSNQAVLFLYLLPCVQQLLLRRRRVALHRRRSGQRQEPAGGLPTDGGGGAVITAPPFSLRDDVGRSLYQ